jgi:hypothetical protein
VNVPRQISYSTTAKPESKHVVAQFPTTQVVAATLAQGRDQFPYTQSVAVGRVSRRATKTEIEAPSLTYFFAAMISTSTSTSGLIS